MRGGARAPETSAFLLYSSVAPSFFVSSLSLVTERLFFTEHTEIHRAIGNWRTALIDRVTGVSRRPALNFFSDSRRLLTIKMPLVFSREEKTARQPAGSWPCQQPMKNGLSSFIARWSTLGGKMAGELKRAGNFSLTTGVETHNEFMTEHFFVLWP